MPYSANDHKIHFEKCLKEHKISLETQAKEKFELLKPIIFEVLNEDIEYHLHFNRENSFYKQKNLDRELKDLSFINPSGEYLQHLLKILALEFPMFDFTFTVDHSGRHVIMRIFKPELK